MVIAQDQLCFACPMFARPAQLLVGVVAQLLSAMEHPTHAEVVHLRVSVLLHISAMQLEPVSVSSQSLVLPTLSVRSQLIANVREMHALLVQPIQTALIYP